MTSKTEIEEPGNRADLISGTAADLAKMAREDGLEMLAHILEMAKLEAQSIKTTMAPGSRSPKSATTRSASASHDNDPLVERTALKIIHRTREMVHARRRELTESNIDTLIDLYLTDDPIAETRTAIEADNARERAQFLRDVRCLTSKQVAENAGHQAANTSVTGSRWKQQGRAFSVPWKGNELYPAFQFRDGQPHPNVAKVLHELPARLSPWQIAFWFTSSNGWLNGAMPAERLDDETAIVAAARRESEPIVG
jgi:hypothetical protein